MITAARNRVTSILRGLGSLLPRASAAAPTGLVTRQWRDDYDRAWPTVGLTPSRLLTILQAADHGYPRDQFELFDEMLQKWPRLAAVEATRRLALTGLNWEIAPAPVSNSQNAALADEAAAFCRETIASVPGFRDALNHMARAIAFGVSIVELVWEDGALRDLIPVPHTRLTADPNEPWRMRLLTENDPTRGVALDALPNKWIRHCPNAATGRMFDRGLLRASAPMYVAQNLSFKDWLIYSQIAGMPVRVARFEPGTPEADQRALLKMLESLGTDAVAAFSKTVDLSLLEAARSGDKPYLPLQDYCNTEITILWLGQHLTTDVRASGSRAAAEIHDRVREDLLVDDIADESDTIQRDLLTPLVRTRFGPDAPVPRFRRSLSQSADTRTFADILGVAVRELGMRVPAKWAHAALGIPEPRADEATLSDAFATGDAE
ncbi:MAG: DUF935 family protein [Phycisphaerales bacterium]|nr:DUF935 family protein [Phycisphaerales bacterium]